MNFRPTAQLREMHDDARCPTGCPLCAQVDAFEPRERGGRELLLTEDYEERY